MNQEQEQTLKNQFIDGHRKTIVTRGALYFFAKTTKIKRN